MCGVVLAAAAQARAPSAVGLEKVPPRSPAGILADKAAGATAEPAADLLIRLAESATAESKSVRMDWLETAFSLARGARYKMRRTGSQGRARSTDTSAGALSMALGAGLDTLSLQSRAVAAMLRLDTQRAMKLFEDMPAPIVPALSCGDATIDSPDVYYGLVSAIYRAGFDGRQKRERLNLQLLRRVISGMVSPVQLRPAARLVYLAGDANEFGLWSGAEILKQSPSEEPVANWSGSPEKDGRYFSFSNTNHMANEVFKEVDRKTVIESQPPT